MSRSTGRLGLVAALALATALAGCAIDDPAEQTGEDGGSTELAAEQDLTVASPYPIVSLDVVGATAADLGTGVAAKALFDTLVVRGEDDFAPSLATDWSSSADGTSWTFTLTPDATFSDGAPVTAADVVATVEWFKASKGTLSSLWASVTATAPDATTVVFTAPEPQGTLLSNLSTLEVLPAAAATTPDFFANPVGSGPFTVTSFTAGESLELTANPDYWGGAPTLETLTFRTIPEVAARVTALETGEIDATWGLPDDQLAGLADSTELTTELIPSWSSYVIWFNSGRGPLTNPDVRRALWHAVDFEKINEALNPETGAAAQAAVTPQVLGFVPQEGYDYDPERAKELLTRAGYADGLTLGIQFSEPQFTQYIQAMISDWAEAGVTVELQQKEKAVWLQDLLALNWDLNFQAQGTATGDADYLLGRLYTCKANRNGYCNPALDETLTKARTTIDEDARVQLYDQAQQTILGDAVGIYPMDVQIPYVWRNDVDGLTPDPNYAPSFATVVRLATG